MINVKETCINVASTDNYATFCSSEADWISHILSLSGRYPDEVKILAYPEENNGIIIATMPKNYINVFHPSFKALTNL